MGFLNFVADVLISVAKEATGKSTGSGGGDVRHGLIDYGKQKKDDSHDHRYNTGSDRTPSQKKADKARQKD
jgi:mevalonate kinase